MTSFEVLEVYKVMRDVNSRREKQISEDIKGREIFQEIGNRSELLGGERERYSQELCVKSAGRGILSVASKRKLGEHL